MTKLQSIRKEYGSFRVAVMHYASMGCGKNATARQLNIESKHFRGLCDRFGLQDVFPPRAAMNTQCRGGRPDIAEHNRKFKRPSALSEARLLDWVEKCKTTREFNEKSPHNITSIYRHFGSWPEAIRRAKLRRMAKGINIGEKASINGTFGRILEVDYIQGTAVMETERGMTVVPLILDKTA